MNPSIFLATLLLTSSASAIQIQCSHSGDVSVEINGLDLLGLSSTIWIGDNGTMCLLSIPEEHIPNGTVGDGLWHPGSILEM